MNKTNRVSAVIAFCIAILTVAVGSCPSDAKPADKTGTLPFWQSNPQQPPSPAVMKLIDSQARTLVESKGRVGVVIGLIDGDKKWVLGYGRKSPDSDTPPNSGSIYEIGSVTKTFTSSALAIMSEKGQVKLSDPVEKYLPKSVKVPSYKGKKITLEHLASQTSGLPRIPDDFDDPKLSPLLKPYSVYTDTNMYKSLGRCRLSRAPGTNYDYSNMGVGLLGLALSHAYGSSYENMITTLVCKPLRMNDTMMTLSKEQRSRLVPGYMVVKKGGSITAEKVPNCTFQDCFAGAGALRSTANDMLTYLEANLATTESPIKQSLQMTQKVRKKIDDDLSIGLGWHMLTITENDPLVIWHDGGTIGYSSFVAFCKERKLGVVLLTNTTSYDQEDEGAAEDEAGFRLMISLLNKELFK